ncbi:MAG: GDSL-type esterase/lipase family protein [Burkholderiales bacterium]|jgi:lysophospholipase L1-like esterase
MTAGPADDGHWVTVWAASAQATYPIGSAIAQPDLSTAIPDSARGLVDQSIRMLLRPALASTRVRVRVSNRFGDRTLRCRGASLGVHLGGGGLVPGSRVAVPELTLAPGELAWSEAMTMPALDAGRPSWPLPTLAFSAFVEGESGPITWHAKAMATSYVSEPGDREAAGADTELGFPHTTTSIFFIDALDAWLPREAGALVAFGDSLTDGTATTLNGFDRWTDVLQRALLANGRHDLAVVNAGIGGNQVVGPPAGSGPWRGGPAAVDRLEHDVLSLSGVRTVVWLQGINDFSENGGADVEAVIDAMTRAVARLRARGLRVVGATVPSALGSSRAGHGGAVQDARRRGFNEVLRRRSPFDALVDLDAALTDPATGRLHAAFDRDSTFGEPGDGVHPGRAGHAAIARSVAETLGCRSA